MRNTDCIGPAIVLCVVAVVGISATRQADERGVLLFEGERPRALVSVWLRGREPSLTKGEIRRELISFSSERLICRREGKVIWSPKTGGLVDQTLANAPDPASRPFQRLAQMRELARRFRSASYKPDAPNELRLLSQPLYRYPNETADDGSRRFEDRPAAAFFLPARRWRA
jgi:hypothetical protein